MQGDCCPAEGNSMLNSLKVQKFIYSRWVLGIFLVVLTHYVTVIYYTRSLSNQGNLSSRGLPPHALEMAEPKKVFFPSNTEYFPDMNKPPKVQIVQPKEEKINLDPVPVKEEEKAQIAPKEETVKEANVEIIKDVKVETVKEAKVATVKPKTPEKPAEPKPEPAKPTPVKSAPKPTQLAVKPDTSRQRLILAWTRLTTKKPLWGIKTWSFMHCPYTNCVMTDNRTRLDEADMLIFRIRELKKNVSAQSLRPYVHPIDPSDIPSHHKQDQIWLDINQESPVYTHADEEVGFLSGKFNLSSNYLLNSDFSISYIPQVKLRPAGDKPALVNYAAGKTKMALWFVSHCGASSGRDEYVKELQKYNITVDILGKCTGKSDGCKAGNYTCYAEVRSKYKFYLALENSICNEYITEKFWNTLQSNAYNIPIALGASVKQYEQFSPPNSFLHTRNFTTVKALADFMIKLDKDDNAYNTYHQWRRTHVIVPREQKETLHCYMCRQANEKKDGGQEYKDISKYWSRKKNCEVNPEPIK